MSILYLALSVGFRCVTVIFQYIFGYTAGDVSVTYVYPYSWGSLLILVLFDLSFFTTGMKLAAKRIAGGVGTFPSEKVLSSPPDWAFTTPPVLFGFMLGVGLLL